MSGARWPSNDAVKPSLISFTYSLVSLKQCYRACNLQGFDFRDNVVQVDLINDMDFLCPFAETKPRPRSCLVLQAMLMMP